MSNKFQPEKFETEIELFWKKNNFFRKNKKANKPFNIIMPPPNVTGKLHLGHAWDSYYPDLLLRYKYLKGFDTAWYAGMDHAGIATQAKVEEKLFNEEKKTRFDLGREKFVKQIWKWKEEYSKSIQTQWEKLGLFLHYKNDKLDNEYFKFTLDEDVHELVMDSFVKFYKKGLIYKDKKLINWDVKLNTAISNIEVEHVEVDQKMYYIKYNLKNSNKHLVVATTRPETMFGDQALFVNPTDKKYKEFIGKLAINPSNGEEIKIIADKYVEVGFGTGVMKCTPGHDFNDNVLGKKYKLKEVSVLNFDGTTNKFCGQFAGLDRYEAREKLIQYLTKNNNLEKIETNKANVGYSSRSHTVAEPMISEQWFLRTPKLAKMCLDNQKKKSKINFIPPKFENDFLTWMKNMEDWCISRQLWWGHRIPAWYKGNEIKISVKSPGKDWKQDEDVLDTWFSSGLWPLAFSKNKSFRQHSANHFSSALFTGYDIIFFWVARMIFMSLSIGNKAPFDKVLIHGLVRDAKGQKMSKSLGNGVDPIEVIDKYGSDSLRLYLLSSSTPGLDIKFNLGKVNTYWDFNNKLFNILNLFDHFKTKHKHKFKYIPIEKLKLNDLDKFVCAEFFNVVKLIDEHVDKYNLTVVIQAIYNFVFNTFANNYLEFIKASQSDFTSTNNALNIFISLIVSLHPFIPFNSEYIYQKLGKFVNLKKSILEESYPKVPNSKIDIKIKLLQDILFIARKIESNPLVNKGQKNIYINTKFSKFGKFFEEKLTFLNVKIHFITNKSQYGQIEVLPDLGISYYDLGDKLIDKKELLKSKKEFIEFEMNRVNKLLSNKDFIKKVSKEKLIEEKTKKEYFSNLKKILTNEI